MDWISVKDELPKVGEPVLVSGSWHMLDYIVDVANLNIQGKFEMYGYRIFNPAYWMPLPEPPLTKPNK